jgi:hypothetical protein
MISIQLTRDTMSSSLAGLVQDVRNATAAARAGGRGVANRLRDHFARLEQTQPNRRGFPRTHFWAGVRGSVSNPVDTASGTVGVEIAHQSIRQKVYGGEIKPGAGKKYLTIPAHWESYGKRAREFSNLQFAYVDDEGIMRPALVAQRGTATIIERATRGKKKFKAVAEKFALTPIYWLVKRVRQSPTPGAVPSDAELQAAAMQGAEEWAAAITARARKEKQA